MESLLEGCARRELGRFYERLPSLPSSERPALLLGMGYNFEFYDALFPLAAGRVQCSMDAGQYSRRYRAMQSLMRPFCSEFGIEAGRPLLRTHRELFAEFYLAATGSPHPELYPDGDANPWLASSRRWARAMEERTARLGASSLDRAKFNLGYLWAVERLSIDEFDAMRKAWNLSGVRADYLDAHCAVEAEHAAASRQAVDSFCSASDPQVVEAVRAHEADLAGYYADLSALLLTVV